MVQVDEELKFIADVHLGKLTKYLRMCGFDTCFNTHYADNEIISISKLERRVILTRDKELLKNRKVIHGLLIKSQYPEQQLIEVLQHFDLKNQVRPCTRCLNCNDILGEVSKEKIEDRLLPNTHQFYMEFSICPNCNNIYWKGSHFERINKFIDRVIMNC